MFNEACCIDSLFGRLLPILDTTRHTYEVVCVDDGSNDETVREVRRWQQDQRSIKLIKLTRNFGKERALAAGLDHARGDAVIPIDADLQDPPELIAQLIEKWVEGFEMVIAKRSKRPGDSKFKSHSANYFYRVMNRFSEVALPPNAGDFRLLDRKVVNAIRELPESTRFHKGLYAWVGYSSCFVEYERPGRVSGTTKWGYWKLWNYALDGIFSFSTVPLKLWTYVGLVTAIFGFGYATYTIARTLIFGIDVPGYASLLVLMLVLNGFLLIGIGVLGEYVGRIFSEVKRRPLYLVESIEQGKVAAETELEVVVSAESI